MATTPKPETPRGLDNALAVISNQLPAWAEAAVRPYVGRQDVNLLLPALPINAELGFGMRPALSLVSIDPDPNHQEIFKVGSRNGEDLYAPSKVALNKMAMAAGIEYRTIRADDRKDRDLCEIEAWGTMRNHAGQSIRQTARKQFYMPDVEEESLAQKMKWKKPNESEAVIRESVKREMAAFRKHLVARTETGAILRLIRSFLAVRQQWTQAEIAKPFVVVRMDFHPDVSDPVVRRAVTDSALNASRALYGDQQRNGGSFAEEVVTDSGAEHEDQEGAVEGAASEAPAPGAAAPLPQGQMSLEPEPDYIASVAEGCRVLGLTSAEKNDLGMRHKGDFKAMYRELNERANKSAA